MAAEGVLQAMDHLDELVSIIIPTYHRVPELLVAVQSAVGQTYPNVEVVVVSDGPDAEARAALTDFHPKVHYCELEVNSGPAEARNRGVQMSRGNWLTFLDDDDSMLPEKIERQMQLAAIHSRKTMISCRTIYRHDGKDDVWPQRPIQPNEDVADYVLVRPSLLARPGVLPVQSLLIHRSLIAAVPFSSHRDHEDWAWLLEVWHKAGARVAFVWKPLVIYNIATQSISRSRRANWRDSLAWAERYQQWLSKDAYNSFLSTKIAWKAKRAGDWRGLRQVTGLVLRNQPRLLDILFVIGVGLLPAFVLHAAWKRSLSGSGASKVDQAVAARQGVGETGLAEAV